MEYPSRLVVEISNVCNFNCQMCIIHEECGVSGKKFLTKAEFSKLSDILSKAKSLVFSGIGEPLLNPEIKEIVKLARKRMTSDSSLKIQTNGYLLTDALANDLSELGVNIFCISVDKLKGGFDCHSLENAYNSLKILSVLKKEYKNFQFGVQIILSRENLDEIFEILNVLISLNTDFIIVSHLIPYTPDFISKVAYDTNNQESANIFYKWLNLLEGKGYTLYDWIEISKKMAGEHVDFNKEVYNIYKSMYENAESFGLTLNFKKLIGTDDVFLKKVEEILNQIKNLCEQNGIEFTLPGVHPKSKRKCDFVENKCMFVSVNGDVSPCYFLWHSYDCYIGNLKKSVKKMSFGNINSENPVNIYNSAPYKKFRENVIKYEFPYCYDCNFALCDLMELEDFMYDCYSNEIPCGACLWCGDLFNCLI